MSVSEDISVFYTFLATDSTDGEAYTIVHVSLYILFTIPRRWCVAMIYIEFPGPVKSILYVLTLVSLLVQHSPLYR